MDPQTTNVDEWIQMYRHLGLRHGRDMFIKAYLVLHARWMRLGWCKRWCEAVENAQNFLNGELDRGEIKGTRLLPDGLWGPRTNVLYDIWAAPFVGQATAILIARGIISAEESGRFVLARHGIRAGMPRPFIVEWAVLIARSQWRIPDEWLETHGVEMGLGDIAEEFGPAAAAKVVEGLRSGHDAGVVKAASEGLVPVGFPNGDVRLVRLRPSIHMDLDMGSTTTWTTR